jgi:ATP-dependent DNA helicase RecG
MTERFDYPVDAIREIVTNMVVHRDYRDSSGSLVKIFDDHIEFFNPGCLIGGMTINDLLSGNYISHCRNKLIARAFKESGLIEQYGSGIKRILNICEDYGIVPPVFEEVFNGFKVTLYKKRMDVTKERREFILTLINGNNKVTISELAVICGVSTRSITRDIEFLRTANLLKRIGGRKSGKWVIPDSV